MYQETIKYVDFDGNEREETFHFHLSEAELVEMQFSTVGGYTNLLGSIIEAQDQPAIIKLVKDIIGRSYGKKSPDGRRFMKSQEILEDFMGTEAYSIMYVRLATDAAYCAKFVTGILPSKLAAQIRDMKDLPDEAKSALDKMGIDGNTVLPMLQSE